MFAWLKSEEESMKREFTAHINGWESEAIGLEAAMKALIESGVAGVENEVAHMKAKVAELRARITHLKGLL